MIQPRKLLVCLFAAAAASAILCSPVAASEWFVAAGGSGNGSSAAPFGRIQDGLAAALAGDTVTVGAGGYAEALRTVRSGTSALPIRLRAAGARGSVTVTTPGTVLRVDHAYVIVEGLVLDGQYAAADAVDVNSGANYLILRNMEVRRSSKDLIDIANPRGMLIEGCLIHHALNAANGRTDAHGIVAGAVQDLTVRNTEIHTFSGDGLQVDPGRAPSGWNRVTIEGSRIWLAPLPAAENGFAAGVVPGENAVDTKANATATRATMVIRDTVAYGFRGGLISNMAAFNLKENVAVTVDRVTVYDSEIAFRLRGPSPTAPGAWVTVKNAVVHSALTAFRYEDNISPLKIWNSTLGLGVTRPFQAASSSVSGLEVRNLLMLGTRPSEASHPSNMTVGPEAFVDANAHNYQLAAGAAAIDAGLTLAEVTTDRVGVQRPQGSAFDVGAYERPLLQSGDVVVHAWRAIAAGGAWRRTADATAAGGWRMWHPDTGTSQTSPLANPIDFFDVIVRVEANRQYRLWIRGRADDNFRGNDSVYVQFSGAVGISGGTVRAIGTKSAAVVSLEDCSGCGLSAWGWQDNKSGLGQLGETFRFAKSGFETIRIQTREDGLSVDQIVLSPLNYMTTAPGFTKNDVTILPES